MLLLSLEEESASSTGVEESMDATQADHEATASLDIGLKHTSTFWYWIKGVPVPDVQTRDAGR